MPNDSLRAGASMWLDSLLYDSGGGEAESLIADDRKATDTEREPSRQVNWRVQ